jgi:hypothetical protein
VTSGPRSGGPRGGVWRYIDRSLEFLGGWYTSICRAIRRLSPTTSSSRQLWRAAAAMYSAWLLVVVAAAKLLAALQTSYWN